MKAYILSHRNGTIKKFKTKKTMRQFLRRNKWEKSAVDMLINTGMIFGWTLKVK
jgi:hypothetical protein